MSWRVPLCDLNFDDAEREAVLRVLASKWLSMGPETEAFEREMAEGLGVAHAVAVTNGTAALHLALLAAGIRPGDAVAQPAVNFVAAANMTLAVGAVPVFVDAESPGAPWIDPEALARAFRERPGRIKAVVVMHYGGYACRMVELRGLCEREGAVLIEDACHGIGGQALDAEGRAIPLGTWGLAGCFSFFSNKNMATGEGGMLVCASEDLAHKARALRSHGMTTLTWDRHRGHASGYDVAAHGFNYRIDELRAALGREQWKKLPAANEARRERTRSYLARLQPLNARGWRFVGQDDRVLDQSSAHLLAAVAPDAETRDRAAQVLAEKGIQTSRHYPFLPDFTAFHGSVGPDALPHARAFCECVLTLPLYPGLSEQAIDEMARELL